MARQVRHLYQAAVGYVSHPKQDNVITTSSRPRLSREVLASTRSSALVKSCAITSTTCPMQPTPWRFHPLPGPAYSRQCDTELQASLRVAFKLRDLELQTMRCAAAEQVALERAFNIVGHPELRACYDLLLADAEAPALFPYGGLGSLLVGGELSRDGKTFFALRILAFSPM